MTEEQRLQWQAKVRSCHAMLLEGSKNPEFELICAVDRRIAELEKENKQLKDDAFVARATLAFLKEEQKP